MQCKDGCVDVSYTHISCSRLQLKVAPWHLTMGRGRDEPGVPHFLFADPHTHTHTLTSKHTPKKIDTGQQWLAVCTCLSIYWPLHNITHKHTHTHSCVTACGQCTHKPALPLITQELRSNWTFARGLGILVTGGPVCCVHTRTYVCALYTCVCVCMTM